MARLTGTPSVRTFTEAWSSEFDAAVKKAAGTDGRLSVSEAKKIAKPYADNATNYFKATGKKSVSLKVLSDSGRAYAQASARTAAGTDGRLSKADGQKLRPDLVDDFMMLRGLSTPDSGGSAVPELKTKLEGLVTDLLMPSETDAQFKFVSGAQLNGAAITSDVVRSQLAAQHDALMPQVMYMGLTPAEYALATRQPVEERSFSTLFTNLTTVWDPTDPPSVDNAAKFTKLRDAMTSELTDLKVFRFGDIEISTLIVGRTKTGELAGLLTGQVET